MNLTMQSMLDEEILYLVQRCGASIRAVTLLWGRNSGEALFTIAENCTELTAFSAVYSCTLPESAWLRLVTGCTKMQRFSIEGDCGVTDQVLCAVAQHCKGLNQLHLLLCSEVTDASIAYLIDHSIPLVSAEFCGHCGVITHSAMYRFISTCKTPVDFYFTSGDKSKDDDLAKQFQHPQRPQHLPRVATCNN